MNNYPFTLTLKRGVATKETNQYDKVLYRFSVMPESDVYIVGLSFLGVPKGTTSSKGAEASIFIQIEDSDINVNTGHEILFPFQPFKVFLQEEESTRIDLPRPIRIMRGRWADIGFQIEGPKTLKMDESIMWRSNTLKSEDGSTIFHTTYSRSPLQLSEMHFHLGSGAGAGPGK